jgi:hypothetical protein
MSLEIHGPSYDEIAQRVERRVDVENITYQEAWAKEGLDTNESDNFNAVGGADSTGIPTAEELPLSPLAESARHIIEATPYRSYLNRNNPEIARLLQQGKITVDEADVLFAAVKHRRAELTTRPKEN